MLRAIIVDDEENGVETLNLLLAKIAPDLRVVAETTDPRVARSLIESYKPEIVFLDINMPSMTGFELLDNLTWKDFNLIFTTAHQEYALKALKNNAIDYLLKPIDQEELATALSKIRQKLDQSSQLNSFNYRELFAWIKPAYHHKILVNTKSGVEHISTSSIVYLESQSNYTIIRLIDGNEITSSKTLKDFELQLCTEDSAFMRVHHSFIVNLNYIVRYQKDSDTIITTNHYTLPVSRSKRATFMQWLKL